MVSNTSSAVNSPRTEEGKQFTFAKEAKSATPASGNYGRGPQTQAIAARQQQFAAGPAPRGFSSTNAQLRKGETSAQNANNKVSLTGRLGRDAVVRYTKNGHVVASFSVAVDESYKDLVGEWHKKTAWHRVQVWEELAETVSAGLQKGVRVYVEGRRAIRNWIDRENRKHCYTEIVAKDVRFLEAAPRSDARNGGGFTQ